MKAQNFKKEQFNTDSENVVSEVVDRLALNHKRVKAMAMLRGKNIRYANELNEFRNDVYIEDETVNDFMDKFRNRLVGCCSQALGQINPNDKHNYVALKTARFCNHRLCCVCNSLRAKKLRRKFFSFFNDEQMDVPVKRKHEHFFQSLDKGERQLSEYSEIDFIDVDGKQVSVKNKVVFHVSGKEIAENFDFMHLTLTVPHKNGLWRGKEYYAQELLDAFHDMRKCEWWSELVYAGEGSVETTQNEGNNLHIHIHALILVKKGERQSRNTLILEILQKWNELTVDNTLDETHFSNERREGLTGLLSFLKPKVYHLDTPDGFIASENRLPNNEDPFLKKEVDKVIDKLDARGSTMVGLSSLYKEITKIEYGAAKRGVFMRDGKYYRYVNSSKPKEMIKGVLECLKYHFEPFALEIFDENADEATDRGRLNVPLLLQLIPNIYRKRLYSKFGAFYGIKALNVTEDVQDEAEDFLETAQSECYCPSTGAPCSREELQFIVFDIKDLVFKKDEKRYSIATKNIKMRHDLGETVRQAIYNFMETVTNKRRENMMESSRQFIT